MPHNRFYYPEEMQKKDMIMLKESEHKHLSKVMRLTVGEEIEIIDGKGSLAKGTIKTISKDFSEVHLNEVKTKKQKPFHRILAQSIMRSQKIDLIIEKATELGIDQFIFFPSSKSEKREFSANQLDRMHQISISACKQSGRIFLPAIEMMSSIEEVLDKTDSLHLYGDLSSKAITIDQVSRENPDRSLLILIGPESGFSIEESSILTNNAIGVKLSQNILRAETASIAAACLLCSEK